MKILILGVGNILFTDECIGVKTVLSLQEEYNFPENVTLLDGGTLGTNLMDVLMDCDLAIVLDAVLADLEPGTVCRLTDNNMRKSVSFHNSLHQTDLIDTLIYCDLAGHRPDCIVIGVQPLDYETMGTEPTPLLVSKMPKMKKAVLDELKKYGIEVSPK